MKKISAFIIRYRIFLCVLFAAILIAAAVCIPFVNINYDDTKYLPDTSNTKAGLEVMGDEFGGSGSAAAMLKGNSIDEILGVKAQISGTKGVAGVVWLDDIFLPLMKSAETGLTDAVKLDYAVRAVAALPKDASATPYDILTALQGEFDETELPSVMALISGIAGVSFDLSDASSLTVPLGEAYASMIKAVSEQIGGLYKDENALFTVAFTGSDYSSSTFKALKSIAAISDKLYLSGNSASAYYMQQNQISEIIKATLMAAAVALAVLFLLSSSWFDPVLYIIVILIAIALNMGSNIIFKDVSYMTESVACVLQLALSMDYAVFLLNRYKKERRENKDAKQAMADALTHSFSPISASSLTTIVCFITIMFMKFKLGLDMGLVMAKGILFSLLTVYLLLPGLILFFDKIIAKSEHKSFSFTAKGISRFIHKFRWVIAVLAVIVMVPCAYFATHNTFVYGSTSSQSPESKGVVNRGIIEETFGSQEQLALLVPKNDAKELALSYAFLQTDGVESVNSWALLSGSGFGAYIPESLKYSLVGSGNYDRIILTLGCEEEGEETKALLAEIRGEIENVYGNDAGYYLIGNTAAAVDMEDNTNEDFSRISIYSIIAVALIVALSFRSALIPVILVAVIEGSVWINMSLPYLFGNSMIFLGYMIISNILLGATIDYAILMTSNYMEARKRHGVADSIREALSVSLRPMLTSGSIFAVGGLILGLSSSFPTVRLLGYSVMRGGICAVAVTVFILPALLAVLDRPIRFLTFKENNKTG